jgi:hypothetical protein
MLVWMHFQKRSVAVLAGFSCAVFLGHFSARGDSLDAASGTNSVPANLGLFHGLDPRSAYNADFFPQPLLVDDTGLEEGEIEFASLDTKANDQRTDFASVGVQKSFGMATFEFTVPYERDADADEAVQGVGNLELGARYPLYQWVSAGGGFDTTMGVAAEIGLPVNSVVSKNAEFDPTIFNDLKVGDHFSLQTVLGYSTLFGGGDAGGLQTFEYGLAFGYAVPRGDLRVPGVVQLTPLFELDGETQLNKEDPGENSLLGSIGLRVDFKAIGEVQPSLAVSFVFPLDEGARSEVHWGIATGLTLEF